MKNTMSLEIPEGYTLPDNVQDGGEFEEVVTFKLEGTKLVPTKLAGIDLPAESKEDEVEEPAGEPGEDASAMPMNMGKRIMGGAA